MGGNGSESLNGWREGKVGGKGHEKARRILSEESEH